MSIKIVGSDLLDEALGRELGNSVRRSMHETGDCRMCGKEIQPDERVRIGVQHFNGWVMTWMRHATCPPAESHPDAYIALADTFRTVPLTTPAASVRPGRWFRREKKTIIRMPTVIVNPSVDAFAFRRNANGAFPDRVLDIFTGTKGFSPGGAYVVDAGEAAQEAGVSASIDGEDIIFKTQNGQRYDAPCPPEFKEPIGEFGGVVLILTTEWLVDEIIQAGAQSLMGFLDHSHAYASLWVPCQL